MRDVDDRRSIPFTRRVLDGSGSARGSDEVIGEEPMEIRIGGVPIAVVMRTPGHDLELAAGFLIGEGVILGMDQIASLRHCDDVDTPEAEDNVVQVVLKPEVHVDLAVLRRNFFAGSSCGICGKATMAAVMRRLDPLPASPWAMAARTLSSLPMTLRRAQSLFERTGGSHAAGLFDAEGRLVALREDVGRHNAVDKLIGWAFAAKEPLEERVLMVSGRVSFDLVQKAVTAGIPMLCAVSAASSLAVEFARQTNLSLVTFLRGSRMCIYAGEARIRGPLPGRDNARDAESTEP